MYKGNKVVIKAKADLWRPTTEEEHLAWRAGLDEEAAERKARGEDTFDIYMDCAGESRLASRTTYRRDTTGDWTVVRARCSASQGWYTVSGCCLLRHTDGTEWYAYRKEVAVVSEGTGPKAKAPKARVGTDADIEAWVEKVDAKFGGSRTIDWGRKYAKIVNGSSVYCFVDRTNGNILKSASWKAPAKGARGNIYADDPLKGLGPYGAAYLR
jgi:hypothetical protein